MFSTRKRIDMRSSRTTSEAQLRTATNDARRWLNSFWGRLLVPARTREQLTLIADRAHSVLMDNRGSATDVVARGSRPSSRSYPPIGPRPLTEGAAARLGSDIRFAIHDPRIAPGARCKVLQIDKAPTESGRRTALVRFPGDLIARLCVEDLVTV